MTPDEFEQQLRRQPVRHVPAQWRDEILESARALSATPRASRPAPSFLSTINSQLSTIFWPHPVAWAGLAAVWLGILALNYAVTEPTDLMARKSTAAPSEVFLALRIQRQELARLTDVTEPEPAEPPKAQPPRPRGELRNSVSFV